MKDSDLIDALFGDNKIVDIGSNEFAERLSTLDQKQFINIVRALLVRWGKTATHCACDYLGKNPPEVLKARAHIKIMHRCITVEYALEGLDKFLSIDPSEELLDESVSAVMLQVRMDQIAEKLHVVKWTRAKRDRMRTRYEEAKTKGELEFTFEEQVFDAKYAGYLLEYLDTQFRDHNRTTH